MVCSDSTECHVTLPSVQKRLLDVYHSGRNAESGRGRKPDSSNGIPLCRCLLPSSSERVSRNVIIGTLNRRESLAPLFVVPFLFVTLSLAAGITVDMGEGSTQPRLIAVLRS